MEKDKKQDKEDKGGKSKSKEASATTTTDAYAKAVEDSKAVASYPKYASAFTIQ